MLDEHTPARRLLEPRLEDLVHSTGLARARRVRVDEFRPDRTAEKNGDGDERKPAERGGLPVVGAPASHARREVVGGSCGHGIPPWRSRTHASDARKGG